MRVGKKIYMLAIVLITVQLEIACSLYCPDQVEVYLGDFPSMEIGNTASIKRLSTEVRRCPNAKTYRVSWKVIAQGEEVGRRAALYERIGKDNGRIGYEADPYSGFRSDVHLVNDDAVHFIAEKGGTFEDFAKYHQSKK